MSDGEHEWQDRMGKAGGCNGLHNAGAVGGLRQQGYNLAWACGRAAWQESVAAVRGLGGSGDIPEKRADVQKGHIGGMVAITACKVHIGSVAQWEILEIRRLSQRTHKTTMQMQKKVLEGRFSEKRMEVFREFAVLRGICSVVLDRECFGKWGRNGFFREFGKNPLGRFGRSRFDMAGPCEIKPFKMRFFSEYPALVRRKYYGKPAVVAHKPHCGID